MLRSKSGARLSLLAVLFAGTCAQALPIYYETQHLGGSSWRYNYTLANENLGAPIEEFTIFFDLNLYANLDFPSAPADWDAIAIQSDPNLAADGFFDALALAGGLDPGSLLGGFSVTFDFLGLGTPGSQPFDIVDSLTFVALASGQTTLLQREPPVAVPEPRTLALLSLAFPVLVVLRRRMRKTLPMVSAVR